MAVLMSIERAGQRYQFPVPVSDSPSLVSATTVVMIPVLVSSIVNFLILAPATRRKMRRHKEKQRRQFYEATIRARKEALTEQRLMETTGSLTAHRSSEKEATRARSQWYCDCEG